MNALINSSHYTSIINLQLMYFLYSENNTYLQQKSTFSKINIKFYLVFLFQRLFFPIHQHTSSKFSVCSVNQAALLSSWKHHRCCQNPTHPVGMPFLHPLTQPVLLWLSFLHLCFPWSDWGIPVADVYLPLIKPLIQSCLSVNPSLLLTEEFNFLFQVQGPLY